MCVYDSSAYFIRDIATGREVLIFGDVEPDAISLSPRNHQVWTDAAPKIVSGLLTAIFIECSYSDSQQDDQLYGHLAPRYLIEELRTLATCVETVRQDDTAGKRRKRKRPGSTNAPSASPRRSPRVSNICGPASPEPPRSRRSRLETGSASVPTIRSFDLDGIGPNPSSGPVGGDSPISPTSHPAQHPLDPDLGLADRSVPAAASRLGVDDRAMSDPTNASPAVQLAPLKGLKIYIIHVKDALEDIEPAGETILRQMCTYEEEEKLGCEFVLVSPGMSVFL
jgi:hypothetical protein